MDEKSKRAVEEFVQRVRERYGGSVSEIMLFGSYARGDYKKDSDIDLLVVWKGDEEEGWRGITRIAFDVLLSHGVYISVKVLTPEDMERDNPFLRNVRREGVVYA
jgi:predicted nucleotidyltransferase